MPIKVAKENNSNQVKVEQNYKTTSPSKKPYKSKILSNLHTNKQRIFFSLK
jgi:hypothetical protein